MLGEECSELISNHAYSYAYKSLTTFEEGRIQSMRMNIRIKLHSLAGWYTTLKTILVGIMDNRDHVRAYYQRWPGLSCRAIAGALKLDEVFVCRATGYPPPVPCEPTPLHQLTEFCPRCKSAEIKKRRFRRGEERMVCQSCGRKFALGSVGGVIVTGTGK